MLRTANSHDPKGRSSSRFDASLSTDAGDQLPGSLTTTRTGLTPASDSTLTITIKSSQTSNVICWAHSRLLLMLLRVVAPVVMQRVQYRGGV